MLQSKVLWMDIIGPNLSENTKNVSLLKRFDFSVSVNNILYITPYVHISY